MAREAHPAFQLTRGRLAFLIAFPPRFADTPRIPLTRSREAAKEPCDFTNSRKSSRA